MSACLSGASGRTYGFDFDFVKSPSTSTRTTSSSPSSTISESSDSPLAISTRKSRTPRKRPNQTYNEAAAMLSTAYPNLFPSESLKKPGKFTKTIDNFADESSELFFPFQIFDTSSFLLQHQPIQQKPVKFPVEPKAVNLTEKSCQSPGEISSGVNTQEFDDDCREDFDAESILDEEIGEGIDSIMGSRAEDSHGASCHDEHVNHRTADSTGFNFGGKFDFRLRALRGVDEGNYWWSFPAVVNMLEISPEIKKPTPAASTSPEKKKKKKTRKVEKLTTIESKIPELPKESSIPKEKSNPGLLLKLNYNEVLNAWSDRSSPFTGESPASDVHGNDVAARLAQIDLLWESGEGGVMREASVLRYKEKRRTRLFSKKIRYQVRKVNADQRPRTQV
ncbi:protein CHLOROPLAST IMPORT APPARATUS 2 isoform X2 [Neltuma alba]|uniref:protein CHLOROPLAST IMPORT APPARATUS 2 isoform X2 n=1 Tax=Neltuma alba TaxID=207710 RepID=UPI0010A435AB|nr:protein CHLOROPLAST IMPORT APPARATUS 2-like isoform X2 [Prosopis alba]